MSQKRFEPLVGKIMFLFLTMALVIGPASAVEPAPMTQSTSFTVNSTTDATDANPGDGVCETAAGNGVCTLRAAIQETNALAGADTVILPSGVYTLTIAGVLEDLAEFGDLDITADLTITGAGEDNTIIDGNELDRVFHILDFNTIVEILGVTIQNGNVLLASQDGGGLYNQGTLTLHNTTVSNNRATDGGGIYNNGTLTLRDSTISGNTADVRGGGIYNSGTLTLNNNAVSGNRANSGDGGGGIYNSGTLTLNHNTISGNTADVHGGGIYNSGTLTLNSNTISDNDARFYGGGVFNETVLTLNNNTISGNRANYGGGISNGEFMIGGGGLTLNNNSISNNHANYQGGGIYNNGTLILNNSTISGNDAQDSGGGIYHGPEGPYIGTLYNASSTLNLSNVTITNNTAGFGEGGGIFNQIGLVNIRNSIIAGNHDNSPTTQHRDCSTARPLDSYGYNLIEDVTGCLIGGDTTGNLTGVSPNLGPLQDNGGVTFTHVLLPGSPAIDAGNPAGCADHEGIILLTDQRGFLRAQDGNGDNNKVCDIGAYELGSSLPTYVYLSLVYK